MAPLRYPRSDRAARRALACSLLAAGLALPSSAAAAPVTVNLRIEGLSSTIYEGPVTTDARTFAKDAAGPQACDGTNGGANPSPGPTMTSALEDGQAPGHYTWGGTWFAGFGDFGIDRIGPDASDNANSRYWGYALNGKPTSLGGCQQQVVAGDEVLFAYDLFSKAHILRLTAPPAANVGAAVTVKVIDGQDGTPVAGAEVAGQATTADGTASVVFGTTGIQSLKAARPDSVRSNSVAVCVHAGDDGTCGTQQASGGGKTPPTPPAALIAGLRSGQRFAAGAAPRLLRGTVRLGSARLGTVRLRLLRQHAGRCQYWSVRFERFRGTDACAAGPYRYSLGDRATWTYLLPAALPPGRFTLEITAIALDGGRSVQRATFTVTSAPTRPPRARGVGQR